MWRDIQWKAGKPEFIHLGNSKLQKQKKILQTEPERIPDFAGSYKCHMVQFF